MDVKKSEKVVIQKQSESPQEGQQAKSRYTSAYASAQGEYNPSDISLETFEKMERDPELALGLKILKSPLFNAAWKIECDDPRVRAIVTHVYGQIHGAFVKSASRALERGFNPHEKIWIRASIIKTTGEDEAGEPTEYIFENAIILEKVKELWPGDITILKKDDRFAGFKQNSGGKTIEVPPEKAVVCTWDERDGNKYGRSVFVNAYDSWYKDSAMAGHMMMYMERRGAPALIIEYPPGQTTNTSGTAEDNRAIALRIGTTLMNNSTVALPFEPDPATNENKWKIHYLEDSKGAANFVTVHTDVFVPAKLRALFIPDLAATKSSDGGGAFALGKVHKGVLTDVREDVMEWYQRIVNELILPDLIRFNFGSEAPTATFSISGLTDNSQDLWVEIVKGLSQNPVFTNQIDIPAILDGLGVPVAHEQEPTAKEQPPEKETPPAAEEEKTEQRRHSLHRQHNYINCGRQHGEPFKLWRDKFEWEGKINFAKIFETVETGTADVVSIIKGLTAEHQIQIEKKITEIWKANKTREARLKAIADMPFGAGTYDSAIRKELTKIAAVGLKEVVAETGLTKAGLVLPDATRTVIEISSKGFTKSYIAGLENEVARGLTGVADMDIDVAKTALKTTFDKYVAGSGSQIANANLLRETSLLTSNAFNEGRAAIMEEGPSKELVAGKMISNALDSNVCPFCAEIGGGRGGTVAMAISVDDPDFDMMEPPFHESCRCFSVYVMRDQVGVDTWEWDYKRPDEDLLLYASQVRGVPK